MRDHHMRSTTAARAAPLNLVLLFVPAGGAAHEKSEVPGAQKSK